MTGISVNLTCYADGNPIPFFKWKFNSTDIRNDTTHTLLSRNRTLSLHNINLHQTGNYSCEVWNEVNGNTSLSSSKMLIVQEKYELLTCGNISCGITESCSKREGRAICTTNKWSVITFVFITLTLIFLITTVILCVERRRHSYERPENK